jgi:hypothetical protein
MGSAKREERLDKERQSLEAAYLDALILALRDCVGGRWGLFGQNKQTLPANLQERFLPESVKRLERIGAELVSIRETLGFSDLFAPMQRLIELQSESGPNRLGEPRLAQKLLDELTG